MKRGLAYWRRYEATGKSRAAEEFSPKRTLPEPEANGGGRRRRRRPLEAHPVARRGLVRWWSCAGARASLGGAIYSRPEAVAVNG